MGAAFVGIAVIAGVAANFTMDAFCSTVTVPPHTNEEKRITIARDSVEQTLSADDAAKREAETLRQHRRWPCTPGQDIRAQYTCFGEGRLYRYFFGGAPSCVW